LKGLFFRSELLMRSRRDILSFIMFLRGMR
jgi:hypothetical protein